MIQFDRGDFVLKRVVCGGPENWLGRNFNMKSEFVRMPLEFAVQYVQPYDMYCSCCTYHGTMAAGCWVLGIFL